MFDIRGLFARILGVFFSFFWIVLSAQAASAQLLMTANYVPGQVTAGNGSQLTYTLTNPSLGVATNAAFSHTLPAGVTIQSLDAVGQCGTGAVTAPSGGTTISLANGAIGIGIPCVIGVNVLTSADGSFSNATGDLTSSLGNSGPTTTNTLTVLLASAEPIFSHNFSPSTIPLGGKSTLVFTINNSANSNILLSPNLSEVLPAGIQIDSSLLATTSCPGSLTADATANTVVYSGSFGTSIAAGATCDISVPIIGQSAGTTPYSTGGLNYTSSPTFQQRNTGSSFASLTVTGAAPGAPLLTKEFTNDPVNQGGTVTVRYTVVNTNRDFDAVNLSFSDDFDAALSGLVFSSLTSNSCGGSVMGASTGQLSLTGGTLPSDGGSCNITATLSVPATGGGSFVSPTGIISASYDGTNVAGAAASDTLVVNADLPPSVTASFVDGVSGGTSDYVVVITNQSATQTITDITFSTSFDSSFPIIGALASPGSGSCGVGSIGIANTLVGLQRMQLTGGTLAAGASCTLTWTLNIGAGAGNTTYSDTSDRVTATLGGAVVQGNAATASLTVGGALNVAFNKSFAAASVVPGTSVDLIFAISVPLEGGIDATAISFTDDLNAMLAGATANTGAAINTCGGLLSGTSTLSVSGVTLAAGATCAITVPVSIPTGAASGTVTNTTSALSATPLGGSAESFDPATANLTVASIYGSASFIPSNVLSGETPTLQVVLTNDGASDATDALFTLNFSGLVPGATGSLLSDGCGGSYVGTSFGIYSGGTIPAGSSCTIELAVAIPASAPSITGLLTAGPLQATVNAAVVTAEPFSAQLTVDNAQILLATSFADTNVEEGGTTTLTFDVENLSTTTAVSAVTFVDNLDSFISGATLVSEVSNTCGAVVAGVGTGLVSVSAGTIPASNSCQISVLVSIPSGTTGNFTNVTSDVTAFAGGITVTGTSAQANLTVVSADRPTFTKSFSPASVAANGNVTVTYQISNPVSGKALSVLQFTDAISTVIPGTTLTVGAGSNVCGAGSLLTGGGAIALANGQLAPGESCTFSATFSAPFINAGGYTSVTSPLTDNGLEAAVAASSVLTIVSTPPTLAQSVAPGSIAQGDVTTLTFTIDNAANADQVNGLGLVVPLPAGVSIAATPAVSSTCGGTSTATAGAATYSFSGGQAAGGASCTVQFDVTSATAGAATFVPANLVSSFGVSTSATATLTVTPAPLPGFAATFAPNAVVQGAETTLIYTVDNTALINAGGFTFSTTLTDGLLIAPVPATSSTCSGASVVAVAGTTSLSVSGGTVAAQGSCTVQVSVITSDAGNATIASGDLTSDLGNSGTASATLTINAAPILGFTAAFAPTSIVQGDVTTLTFTLDNSSALVDATAVDFSNTLPSDVLVADPSGAVSTCTGGTLSAAAGASNFSYTGGSVPSGATCTIAVTVTSDVVGAVSNTSGDLTSSLGNSGTATANFAVTAAPLPTLTLTAAPSTIEQGAIATIRAEITNTSLVSADTLSLNVPYPAGVASATPLNFATNCVGGSSVDGGNAQQLSAPSLAAGASCYLSFDVTASDAGAAVFTTGPLTSTLGDSGVANATLNVTAAGVPAFSASFAPTTILQGEVSTLALVIDNSANLVAATNGSFTAPFPAGMVLAANPNPTASCTVGTAIATPVLAGDGSSGSVTGIEVDAGAICTYTLDVTTEVEGDTVFTSGDLVTSLGNSGSSAGILRVNLAEAPSFAAEYVPDSIAQGAESVLTYTISNAALVDVTLLAFSETLPAGVTIADTPGAATTCGAGVISATAGNSTLSFAGGQVATGADCTVSVTVTSQTVGSVTGISSALTSSQGDSGTAISSLEVTGADGPSFAKAFSPDAIVQGEVSTLTFTIDNATSLVSADDLAFSDPMPAGMIVAEDANIATTCTDGAVTAASGSDTIAFVGATLPAAESCTVSVDVVLVEAGTATNLTGDLTSSLGNSGTATAELTATAATAPTFAKVFVPANIAQGEVSRMVFTIDNSAAAVAATDLAFVDSFPSGLNIAGDPAATSTCDAATLTASAGMNSFAMTSGTVAAGATCEVAVNVTAVEAGSFASTSGDLTSSLGDSGTASATLSVTASGAPTFTNRYSPPSIVQGGVSRLILTVNNSGARVPATALGFDVTLPDGLFVDGSTNARVANGRPDLSNTCGGTAIGEANATTVTLSGGTVSEGTTCSVSVNVTSETAGTLGPVTGSLRSSLGGATLIDGGAGPLEVEVNPEGRLTIIQNASEDGTYGFSSTAAGLNFSITTSGGSGSQGPIVLSQGTYVIQQSRPEGVGNTALSCSDSDSSGDPFTGALTLNLGPNEAVTCTYSSLSTQQKTTEVINSFLNRRNNLILSNGPSRARRLDRLRQGVGGSETLTYQNGDLKSFAPVNFNLLSAGSGSYSISTSLNQVERSALMFGLAHDGVEGNSAIFNPRRFDIWFEAHYNEFKASQGSSGHFGIAYLGADYLITSDILAGAMLQFDSLDDSSPVTNSTVSGRGWMVGPYVTARLAPNLIFDGRLAYGKSTNKIKPFNTYEDEFDTDRFLIDASLSGNFDWDNWVVTPNLSISYIEERQKAYTDSLNVAIPGQKVSLGQIKFGPTFTTTLKGRNNAVIQPSFTVNGIYNFGNRSGPVITNNTADETNGLRARVEAAVRITNRYGTQIELGANYDGIGASDFESWGANFKLTIPLNK